MNNLVLLLATIMVMIVPANGFRLYRSHLGLRNKVSSRGGQVLGGSLRMAASDELDPNVGYGPLGSLTRQGLVPYVIRIVKNDTYEAAVSKYAAKEKCSRLEAMANMDAYFADPNGWAGDKLREKNGTGPKRDYINANQNPFGLALTAVWAIFISGLFWRIFQLNVLDK